MAFFATFETQQKPQDKETATTAKSKSLERGRPNAQRSERCTDNTGGGRVWENSEGARLGSCRVLYSMLMDRGYAGIRCPET